MDTVSVEFKEEIPNKRSKDNPDESDDDDLQKFFSLLPKGGHDWGIGVLYQYQGFWLTADGVKSVMAFQQDFKAIDTDLILTTSPRSGTLWLKSLSFAIVNRSRFSFSSKQHENHPLLTTSPHDLVPFLDFKHFYGSNPFPDFSKFQSPRLLSTHVPYSSLPDSIKNSHCKLVYMCRNPKDTFVSRWHFENKLLASTAYKMVATVDEDIHHVPIEKAFDLYCNGVLEYGPVTDHILGYWKESLDRPEKVLFLKYEDMIMDSQSQVKKLAEFLGYPFSLVEESEGVIDEIISLCSFDHLRVLNVNKFGTTKLNVESKVFFRKGEVGDWKNYLTPQMAEKLDLLFKEKLGGSGLVFQDHLN